MMDIDQPDLPSRMQLWTRADWFWMAAIVVTMVLSSVRGIDILSPRAALGGVAVMWVPSAVLVVAIVRRLDSMVAVSTHCGVFFAVGLIASLGNTSLAGTAAFLVLDLVEVAIIAAVWSRFGGARFEIDSVRSVGRFVTGCLTGCTIAAFGAFCAARAGLTPAPEMLLSPVNVAISWFTSNLSTYILLGAALVGLTGRQSAAFFMILRRHPATAAAAFAALVAVTVGGMGLPHWLLASTGIDLGNGALMVAVAPVAVWAAFRAGPTGAAVAIAMTGVPAVYATALGLGPFGGPGAPNGVYELQISIMLAGVALLLIGTMAEELRGRSAALERALERALSEGGPARDTGTGER